ncbi:response regulator [Sandaracinobacteroides sp. A072]|uniref:response regulator n=1 Tax=Sandaracinobacteroides sp. A072 TaxID=3461146 RepID=UPI004043706E
MTDTAVSLRATLGPHLPFLRRHARALTGSQKSGDSFVRATLEALLEDPASLPAGSPPKLALFRLFHACWGPHADAASVGATTDEGSEGHDVLPGLATGRREALLLTAVEGFSTHEAAEILGLGTDEVEAAIAGALAAISDAIRSRVLVIEDEPIIAMHIEQIVEDMGHKVVASATTRDEAVEAATREAPDLVLADIQLADGSSGIDAVKDILDRFDVPVIFITAYPERLLTGERPEPTYLVTKPFEPETVVATIGQALLSRQKGLAPA